jgi:hypothetical protein
MKNEKSRLFYFIVPVREMGVTPRTGGTCSGFSSKNEAVRSQIDRK